MVEYAPHQLECSRFCADRPATIMAMATGTGKTVTSIATMLRLTEEHKAEKNLICATKGSLPEIQNDFRNFYNYEPFIIRTNEDMETYFKGNHNVGMFRYEFFKNIPSDNFNYFLSKHKNSLFIDEAQKLKNSSTKAHKYIKSIRENIDNFHLMTATPLMTSLDDLYNLMYLVDPRVLGDYDTYVKNYYVRELAPLHAGLLKKRCPRCRHSMFYANGLLICPRCQTKKRCKSKYDLVEYKNMDSLSDLLKNYMYCYYPKQDIRYHVYTAPLLDSNSYVNIAHDILNDTDKETPYSTRLIELQHCASRDINKLKILMSVVQSVIHEGCIVYCAYLEAVALVQGLLNSMGIENRVISGDVSDSEREEVKAWFKGDASHKALILTAAGGASLNLQVTPHFIFYETPWGSGNILQALGRVCRMFSKYKTFYIHFVCAANTIDVYKYEVTAAYKSMMDSLLNNNYLPKGQLPSFNKHLIARMRQDLCWKR